MYRTVFLCFQCENNPTVFFNQVLFFYPEHIEIVKNVPKGTHINTQYFKSNQTKTNSMRKLFIVCLVNLSIAANAGKGNNGNGNQNGKGNGGNGNHYGWVDDSKDDNPGEVVGDPDEPTNVPIDDYVPVFDCCLSGLWFIMNRKRIAVK
jgi:hypothetical protein